MWMCFVFCIYCFVFSFLRRNGDIVIHMEMFPSVCFYKVLRG